MGARVEHACIHAYIHTYKAIRKRSTTCKTHAELQCLHLYPRPPAASPKRVYGLFGTGLKAERQGRSAEKTSNPPPKKKKLAEDSPE